MTAALHANWIDNSRGRTLRWMESEGISQDVAVLTDRVRAMCQRRGLEMALEPNQIYSRIMDLLAARFENPQGVLCVRSAHGAAGGSWSKEEEQVWIAWLHGQLSPEAWTYEVFDGLDEAEMEWGKETGRWREELMSIVPYWIARSRDLLSAIDPRPIGSIDEEGDE
jgi:hypothetical protein